MISGSLGSRSIVGAAGLGIGIGAGNFAPDSNIGHFGREFSGAHSVQTTLSIEESDETTRTLKPFLTKIGWWGLRLLLYTFYLVILIFVLRYTYKEVMSKVAINVFLVVLSVILVVFILFCVCSIVFI